MTTQTGRTYAPAVTDPVARVVALEAILSDIERQLRIALDDLDLPADFPPDLHPADVIEKHLVRPLYERLSDLGWAQAERPD